MGSEARPFILEESLVMRTLRRQATTANKTMFWKVTVLLLIASSGVAREPIATKSAKKVNDQAAWVALTRAAQAEIGGNLVARDSLLHEAIAISNDFA